ncbi:DUF4880 domain-containing protein [Pseudomonas taetrolens]|uniref:DUF4880 domain-containing protein n=1 Tax=Pseudomonas taetrolens TaxID=47884 RepID=UPI00103DAC91
MSKLNRVDDVTRAAVRWLLRLESGHACASERQVFKAWLAESPDHLAAWRQVAARGNEVRLASSVQWFRRTLPIGLAAVLLGLALCFAT